MTTYVIFSGGIKNPLSELTEGINTYRIIPISLQDWRAESVFSKAKEKLERTGELKKEDFLTLLLTPVMGGEMDQWKRFEKGFRLMKEGAAGIPRNDMLKLQAMYYTFASKFLDRVQFDKMKEGLKMTWLGEMLREDALAEGLEKGMEKGINVLIHTCKELGLSYDDTKVKVYDNFDIPMEKAQSYMEMFW